MQAAILKPSRTAPSSKPVHTTETYMAALSATGYVRLPVASAVCGVAKSTIWAWTTQGRFPKPVKLSPRVSAWPVADVRAWLADPVAWQAANKAEGKTMATTTKEKGRDSCKSTTPTTSPNDTALTLHPVKGEPRIDSPIVAQHLGNQHESVTKQLMAYADDFRQLGILRFQIAKLQAGSMGGRPEKYAMLNEDQAYLLLTYSRNTSKVRALKVRLVLAFREARQAQDQTRVEYLPTYHALHDEIHTLAGQSPNERFIHMNVNKLVNKAVGIGAGERGRLDVPRRSMLIAAQYVVSTAMHCAADHHEGYVQAKDALDRFGVTLLGGGHHAQ